MKILSTAKKQGEIRFLIRNINYNNIQAAISQNLPDEHKLLLAKFSDAGKDFKWYIESDDLNFKSFERASQKEKELIGDYLNKIRPLIENIIKTNRELSSSADAILNIPGEDKIFFAYDNNDNIVVTLTQWGFASIGSNAYGNIISRVITDHPHKKEDIVLQLSYSCGKPIGNHDFYIYLNNDTRKILTDAFGHYNLGNTLVEKSFKVSLDPQMKEDVKNIDIEDDKTNYEIVFPFYTTVSINVLNQYDEPYNQGALVVEGQRVGISIEGSVFLEKIEYLEEKKLKVSNADADDQEQEFLIAANSEENNFIYKVEQSYDCFVKITTISPEGVAVGNYKLQLKTADETSYPLTDSNGILVLPNRTIGEEIEVTDWNNPNNTACIKLQREENRCELIVAIQPEKEVKINLVDHANEAIKGVPLHLGIRSGAKEQITDVNGEIRLPYDIFDNGEKIKCSFSAEKINGKRKNKNYKSNFTFKENQLDYTLRIKKANLKWLWLLALLLLLPLFINLEKDVSVQVLTMDSTPIPNSTVSFEFRSHYLYKNKKFFNKEQHSYVETTDAEGIVQFKKIGYSVYSAIFHCLSHANISIIAKCEEQKEITEPLFHFIRESKAVSIFLKQKLIDLSVRVIDRELNSPIMGAEVNFKYATADGPKELSLNSDENGDIRLRQVCYCGTIESITANEFGYQAYSQTDIDVIQALKEDPNITVKLIPEKNRISFFVKNKYSQQAIPNATATISFNDKRTSNTQSSTVKTNVDGMGCGFYDDLFLLADINIEAECKYFKPGALPYSYRVDEFLALPDSLRTVYLVPEEYVQSFQNIDSLSQAPIAGVTNQIIVESINGQTYVDKQVSNNKGYFNVKARQGDKIKIESVSNPHYYNKTSTVDFDEKQQIEMSKIHYSIPFRTIDDYSKQMLPNCDLTIYINGKNNSLIDNSSDSAIFVIEAYSDHLISIVASKQDYQINNYQINNISAYSLSQQTNDSRDVLMKLNPCESGGDATSDSKDSLKEYDMKQINGFFKFEYNSNHQADIFEIFDCRKEEIGHQKPIFRYDKSTNNEIETANINFTNRIITVKVTSQSIIWWYKVNCPE